MQPLVSQIKYDNTVEKVKTKKTAHKQGSLRILEEEVVRKDESLVAEEVSIHETKEIN